MGFLDSVRGALRDAVSGQASRGAAARKGEGVTDEAVVDQALVDQAEPEVSFETYTITTGDTLGEIGARFGVSRQEVATLNDIDEPDLIFPGQVLRIPKT